MDLDTLSIQNHAKMLNNPILYIVIYIKVSEAFVLVPWMRPQCPVYMGNIACVCFAYYKREVVFDLHKRSISCFLLR